MSPLELEAHIDGLARLCLAGRHGTAARLADAQADPLTRALGQAAVAAARADIGAVEQAVAAAAAVAPGHTLVLQARAILATLQGDTAHAVERATQAVGASTAGRSAERAQLGLARTLLHHGQRDPACRTKGMELLAALAERGPDVDAHLQLAAEIAARPEGNEDQFLHLSAAFLAKPTDPRPMQQLLAIYREQSWPIGVAMLARHVRGATDSGALRYMSDLLALAAALYLSHSPWAPIIAPSEAQVAQALAEAATHGALARCTLASLLIDLGRLAPAERALAGAAAVLETPEERSHHAFMRGRLVQARGDLPAAVVCFRAAFDSWPEHLDAACNFIDLTMSAPTPAGMEAIGQMLQRIPEVARRNHLQLSYNEALWHEARGDRAAALAAVDALLEGPLGALEPHARHLRGRLAGQG